MTGNRLKIGLIQLRCEKLAVDANLAERARYIAEADDRGAEAPRVGRRVSWDTVRSELS